MFAGSVSKDYIIEAEKLYSDAKKARDEKHETTFEEKALQAIHFAELALREVLATADEETDIENRAAVEERIANFLNNMTNFSNPIVTYYQNKFRDDYLKAQDAIQNLEQMEGDYEQLYVSTMAESLQAYPEQYNVANVDLKAKIAACLRVSCLAINTSSQDLILNRVVKLLEKIQGETQNLLPESQKAAHAALQVLARERLILSEAQQNLTKAEGQYREALVVKGEAAYEDKAREAIELARIAFCQANATDLGLNIVDRAQILLRTISKPLVVLHNTGYASKRSDAKEAQQADQKLTVETANQALADNDFLRYGFALIKYQQALMLGEAHLPNYRPVLIIDESQASMSKFSEHRANYLYANFVQAFILAFQQSNYTQCIIALKESLHLENATKFSDVVATLASQSETEKKSRLTMLLICMRIVIKQSLNLLASGMNPKAPITVLDAQKKLLEDQQVALKRVFGLLGSEAQGFVDLVKALVGTYVDVASLRYTQVKSMGVSEWKANISEKQDEKKATPAVVPEVVVAASVKLADAPGVAPFSSTPRPKSP